MADGMGKQREREPKGESLIAAMSYTNEITPLSGPSFCNAALSVGLAFIRLSQYFLWEGNMMSSTCLNFPVQLFQFLAHLLRNSSFNKCFLDSTLRPHVAKKPSPLFCLAPDVHVGGESLTLRPTTIQGGPSARIVWLG